MRRRARLVEVFADARFEQGHLDDAVVLCDSDAGDEIEDGLGGVATPPHAAEGGHARVVPAGDVTLFNESAQLALAHDGERHFQAREFDLTRLEASS